MSALSWSAAVIVFLIGLVPEQATALMRVSASRASRGRS